MSEINDELNDLDPRIKKALMDLTEEINASNLAGDRPTYAAIINIFKSQENTPIAFSVGDIGTCSDGEPPRLYENDQGEWVIGCP